MAHETNVQSKLIRLGQSFQKATQDVSDVGDLRKKDQMVRWSSSSGWATSMPSATF